MLLVTRNNKNIIKKIDVYGPLTKLNNPLENIYQNSQEIKDIKMEASPYQLYGCRVIALYRMLMHRIIIKKIEMPMDFNIVEFDKLADEGGIKDDAWQEGYWDVLNSIKFIEKFNKKFYTNFKIEVIRARDSKSDFNKVKNDLIFYFKEEIPFTIKMDSLVNNYYHFVNVDSMLETTDNLYFRMKETWNYDGENRGYNNYWTAFDIPYYYELII